MSDVMLLGVLRMPPELWQDTPLDVTQRHSRYVEAADEIERLRAELSDAELAGTMHAAMLLKEQEEVRRLRAEVAALSALSELHANDRDKARAEVEAWQLKNARNVGMADKELSAMKDERDRLRELLRECAQALMDCTHPNAPQLSIEDCPVCDLCSRIDAALGGEERDGNAA